MIGLLLAVCTDEQKELILHVYNTYYPTMFRIAYDIVKDKETASDIVHDVMVNLVKNSSAMRIDGKFPLKTYVLSAIRNAGCDYLRKSKAKPMFDIDDALEEIEKRDTAPSALDVVIEKEQYHSLVRSIRELPQNYKDACYLRYVCSMDISDIAKVLGISSKNVLMRVNRGRKMLIKNITEVNRYE